MNPSASSEKWSACFGSDVKTGSELLRLHEERARKPLLATGVPPLDHLTNGGLARGTSVELAGGRSSGRFAIGLAALAGALRAGEAAALIDLGDHLDLQAAVDAGVDLSRLLWIRPLDLHQAVMSAEMVLGAGFALVVLDLGSAPVSLKAVADSVWMRLAKAARDHSSILLTMAPSRLPAGAADLLIQADPARAAWLSKNGAPPLLAGLSSQLTLERKKGGYEIKQERLGLGI